MKLRQTFAALLCLLLGTSAAAAQQAPPANPGLLLTEIFYDTPGVDGEEEWIEIANVGTAVLDLSDVAVGDEETAGGREGMARFPEGARIEPGQAVVVAQTAVGFRRLYGFNPNYEFQESDPNVPVMRRFPLWATGDFALANDGDEVLLLSRFVVIDAVNYGDSTTYFAPAIAGVFTGQSVERVPANCDSDTAADWQPRRTPTPGVITLEGECAVPANPALREALPPIGEIQGSGDVSPLINQIVAFRGVVTGVMADRNAAGITFHTIFVQDLPGMEDGDPATSDGIAVFLGRERPSMSVGDQVRVSGQVTEFFGLTEIDDDGLQILVEASDQPLPPPAPLPPHPDAARAQTLEPLESMRVAAPDDALVIGPTIGVCSFVVAGPGTAVPRIFQRSSEPATGWPLPILHVSDVDCSDFPQVKTGDRVSGLAGPLTYHFDEFKIVQQETAVLDTAVLDTAVLRITEAPLPPPPAPPALTGGQISIASFNLENHFDDVDDTGSAAEPKPSAAQIAVKEQKLAHAIHAVLGCPTLLGAQEVENEALLLSLAQLLAAPCGFVYEVTHRESVDGRGIDVALLSDPQRVAVQAAALAQGCTRLATGVVDASISCADGEQPLFARPPLRVDVHVEGRPLTLFVNHLKSKREGEAETAVWRLAQAQHLSLLVNELLAQDAQAHVVVLGDLNDYEQSPPLDALTDNGRLINALLQIPDEERYSFIFGGRAQLIDGILLSPALATRVDWVRIQHVNADFPAGWAGDVSDERLAFRSSDHDLPLLALTLPAAAPAVEAVEERRAETAVGAMEERPLTPAAGSSQAGWQIGLALFAGAALIGLIFWRRRRSA